MRGCILVVDDEPLKRITLRIELSEQGLEVYEAADAETARRIFDSHPIDVVVSDVRLPGMNGLDLLTYVKQQRPEVGVILMTAYAAVDTAVLAMKRGAYDYIAKPFTTEALLVKLERLLAAGKSAGASRGVEQFGALVAASQSMKRLFQQARALADSQCTVLLCGESGTGKELLAESIHAHSRRSDQPLVRIDCGGLPSAGFGSGTAAVGSALSDTAGAAAADYLYTRGFGPAQGGTILLDEIDALAPELQAHLLRVMERQAASPAGSAAPAIADVRIICATKRDLPRLVQEDRFRQDLHYRLSTVCLTIPALRERTEDIPVLVQHLLEQQAGLVGKQPVTISPHALDELVRHAWPGNVRELEQVVTRAVVLSGGQEIRPEHILPLGAQTAGAAPATQPLAWVGVEPGGSGNLSLAETVADIERRMILSALQQCENNQVRAAQRLGLPRTTLRDKMAKYHIPGG